MDEEGSGRGCVYSRHVHQSYGWIPVLIFIVMDGKGREGKDRKRS